MSALRLAEMILTRSNERLEENHMEMDKGKPTEAYRELVGKNKELRWIQTICREFLAQVESEEDLFDDDDN